VIFALNTLIYSLYTGRSCSGTKRCLLRQETKTALPQQRYLYFYDLTSRAQIETYPSLLQQLVISFEYLDTWKEFEAVLEAGKSKSIGVSNFEVAQLEGTLVSK